MVPSIRQAAWALMGAAVLAGAWVYRPPSSASVEWLDTGSAQTGLLVAGTLAPRFSLASTEGDTVRSELLYGGRVGLLFVRPGCPHCEALLASVAGVQTESDATLYVVCGSGTEEAQRLRDKHSLAVTVLVDSAGTVGRQYQAAAVPLTYIIAANGRVEASARGMPAARELLDDL